MSWIKKYKYYFLAFIIPILGYILIFNLTNIYFNTNYIPSDAKAQYIPTFSYLYNLLHGKANFPYTFTKGVGGTMYGAYAYGISSPLNLFIIFFKDTKLFFMILLLFKIGLSGLNSFIYFRKTTKYKNINILIFSLFYTFSSYFLIYCFNIMWFDAAMLLPILLLGIENIINKNSDRLYIFTLLYLIIANYYTGYMIVVFSIIYYLYYSFNNYNKNNWLKDNYKKILRFIFITFLIGCSTMFILIPTALESRNFIRIDDKLKIVNFIFYDLFSNTYTGMGNIHNPLNYKNILVFFSVIMIPLLANYFLNKNISKKEKISSMIVLALFYLPTIIPAFNYLWHLFTYPQGFNYRYSFITTFFLIKICLKSFHNINIDKKKLKLIIIIYTILSVPLIILTKNVMDYYIYLSYLNIIATILLLILYYIFIYNRKVLYFIIVIDMIINVGLVIYQTDTLMNKTIIPNISYEGYEEKCRLDYRCDDISAAYNFGLEYNFNSVSSFLSSTNSKINKFMYAYRGVDYSSNFVSNTKDEILIDNILGIKYIFINKGIRDINYYKLIDQNENIEIYENNNALKLGYLVNKDIKNYKNDKVGVKKQISVINTMFNRDYKLVNLDYETINNKHIKLKVDDEVKYFYIDTDVELSDKTDGLFMRLSKDSLLFYIQNNKEIDIYFDIKPKTLKIYTIEFEKLNNFKEGITELDIKVNKGNYIKGVIKGDKNKILMTTIPYEKGWTVYVDGKKVKHYEVLDTFIALDIKEGKHTVVFKYKTPGLKLGLLISFISFITLSIYELKRRKY